MSTGGGIDATVQRFARATLDGAACQLHTTREELVLSFVPSAGTKRIRWNRQTIDRALRAGLDHASHELAGNGIAGAALSFALRQLFAPSVEWFLQHTLNVSVMNWEEFARRVRTRRARARAFRGPASLCMLGTLRPNGCPRISPCEATISWAASCCWA